MQVMEIYNLKKFKISFFFTFENFVNLIIIIINYYTSHITNYKCFLILIK